MSQYPHARVLGWLAVFSLYMLILSGCGASNAGRPRFRGPSGPYDTAANSAAYQQAISGFMSASSQNKVQALMFHVLTPGDANFSDFMSNIFPNISGVSVALSWNQIETSQGNYDFSGFDASLQPYEGKQINLIVWPATEGGNNDPNNGGSTPAYVFGQSWATTTGAAHPLDMTVCQDYTGDTSNPEYASALAGNGGLWNTSTSSDMSGLPVSYEAPFMVAYQNFIVKVIQHYNAPGAPQIGYIRFGFSQGGEDSPECNQFWPGYSKTAYLSYVQTMTNFVHAQSPSMTILADLHAVGIPPPDEGYADSEATYAVADGFGIGTNGLQQNDVLDFPNCDSDWCNLFSQHPGRTLSLQTLQWSDPTDNLETGSLATLNGITGLIPFAQAHGANNLELYLADLALAYSPNYCTYQHAVC